MINIFDASAASIAAMMTLTEKAYRDDSPSRRGWNDASSKLPNFGGITVVEDKPITHESKSLPGKKSSGMPMKRLIEREMCKELDSRQNPPTVVAKLMGLEALPVQQQPDQITRSSLPQAKSNKRYGAAQYTQHQGKVSLENMVAYDNKLFHPNANENKEFKDIYEVSQLSPKSCHFKDEPFLKGRCREVVSDKRMALVRQKFQEAKRLATNQKLIQSKEFQEALEVLSSNRDLFIKFLEEPNSLFSDYLHEIHTSRLPPQSRRITVLKPSKSLDAELGRNMKYNIYISEHDKDCQEKNMSGWGSSFLRSESENLTQPTRIVVLKPSHSKPCNTKALIASSPSRSHRIPQAEDIFEDLHTDVARDSGEVAKDITRQTRDSFSSRRDETVLSSILSNGYTGDESSIYRSEDDNIDECCNLSDLEITTPTSRYSCDCVNTFDSPYSLSSFSRLSCSPEPSVIREAKKRLSERWVMQSSNVMSQQRQLRSITSTLGEMLSLTESKKEDGADKLKSTNRGGSFDVGQDMNVGISGKSFEKSLDVDGGGKTPRGLQRSKSIPISSSVCDTVRSGPIVSSQSSIGTSIKQKSGKSSLRGKLSSLLFLKSRKSSSTKDLPSLKSNSLDKIQSGNKAPNSSSRSDVDMVPRMVPSCEGRQAETPTTKIRSGIEKPRSSDSGFNLRQPSPVPILQSSFDNDANSIGHCESSVDKNSHRTISRSPPIESVARSLHWNGAYGEESIFNPSSHSTDIVRANVEEREQAMFIDMLLLSSGLGDETSTAIFSKWHSLDSPLNPALLDKFMERKEVAKCRVRRSKQRLIFDSVNAVLLEIGWNREVDMCMYSTSSLKFPISNSATSNSMTKEVSDKIKEWFSSVDKFAVKSVENGSQLVDYIVRRELVGNGWIEMARSEVGELGKQIGGQVLEDLVGEALEDFISVCMR